MMSDKKVDRDRRERSLTPTQKLASAISDPGTLNMAEPTHDKAKSNLTDKFRKREERWRQEQTFHDQEMARENEAVGHAGTRNEEPPERKGPGEGGGQ